MKTIVLYLILSGKDGKKRKWIGWLGIVHECLNIKGNIVYSPIKIFHDPKKKKDVSRNLALYEKPKRKEYYV